VTEHCTGGGAACPADAFQPSTVDCRPATFPCDPAESCTGSNAACPPDGSHGTVVMRPMVVLKKLTTPVGDDGLTFKGQYVLAPDVLASLDPVLTGARVLIQDSTNAVVLDATIPSGAYDTGTKTGWRANAANTKWTYLNPMGVQGITKIAVGNKDSVQTPGRVTFGVRGKNGGFAVAQGNLPLTGAVVFDPQAGDCAAASFPGPAPLPVCAFTSSGSTLKCK
jgi:hypothetical protein